MTLILIGLILGLTLCILVVIGKQPIMCGCGCLTNVVIGLILVGVGLLLLMVAGILPANFICERVSYVSVCFN
jgi:hypothetical protein